MVGDKIPVAQAETVGRLAAAIQSAVEKVPGVNNAEIVLGGDSDQQVWIWGFTCDSTPFSLMLSVTP